MTALPLSFCIDQAYQDLQPNPSANSEINIENYYDRAKINNALSATFGRDASGRQIHKIVTDFIGYTSCESSSSWFATFMKKCNDIITPNNLNKPTNERVALILQTSSNEKDFFSNSDLLPQLVKLTKTHYVVLRLIGLRNETLKESIDEVAKELGNRSIMTLIIRADGTEDGIQIGDANFYTISDVKTEDFTFINPNATIIINSRLINYNLAKKIAAVQSRSVFAYTKECCEDYLTFCCDNHGYGVLAFDRADNQIAKKFTYEQGNIKEEMPCCTIDEEIEKIKKIFLEDSISAAQLGDSIAQCILAGISSKGQNVAKSFEYAIRWYEAAAAQNDPIAQCFLGLSCAEGLGINESNDAAVTWFLQAARQGNDFAQFNLGFHYSERAFGYQANEHPIPWYFMAAEQGNAHAQCNLGVAYENSNGVFQCYKTAVKWYLLAAEQGDPIAQKNLGTAYSKGRGVPQCQVKAVHWYLLAAAQEDVNAQYNLAIAYAKGEGVPQSDENMIRWFLKAAIQGDASAQYNLGFYYSEGIGVPRSYEEAEKWYTEAADQGHSTAQYNLSLLYYNGHCKDTFLKEAKKWATQSADQGNEEARNLLKEIVRKELDLIKLYFPNLTI